MNFGNIIGTVLTSAVVVAIIEAVVKQKSNKLDYITGERSKWREKLKKIALEIEGADMDNIHKTLTELKVNVNYYGNVDANGVELEKIDFFRDEHIWMEINKIEECCEKKNKKEFKECKKKLIDYIGFLLKFDWERSKKEIKVDVSFMVTILLNVICIIYVITEFNRLQYKSPIVKGIGLMIPNVIVCGLGIYEKFILPKLRIWFREETYVAVLGISLGVYYIIEWLFDFVLNIELEIFCIWTIIFLCTIIFMVFTIIIDMNLYVDYENHLKQYMKINIVTIYYSEKTKQSDSATSFFDKKRIKYQQKKIDDKSISIEEVKKAYIDREDEEVKDLKNYMLGIKNPAEGTSSDEKKVSGYEKKERSVANWLANSKIKKKFIVVYRKNGKVDMTIGKDKKIWKEWLRN